jgi:serine/threonine protein kinase, bacterial
VTSQHIGSHYLLHEQIGQGAMGTVWRAEDTVSGAWYAVKVLRPEYALDPAAVTRFVRERNALLALRHPNVVTLHDMIVEGEQLALVMDLLTEGDLGKLRRDHGGTLPPGLAAALVAQVCDGLAAAHAAGIVHRDLKPGNVLMDGGLARLTDFGIARIGGEAPVTTAGTIMGTVSYMAPEALRGAEPAPACDVYAAGVTLYELLTGRPPFTGQPAMVIHDHLNAAPRRPDGLPDLPWNVIAACLAKDPAARPSAAELTSVLGHPQVFSGATLPSAPQPGEPTNPGAPQAPQVPLTIAGVGWLSPAGPALREPAGPAGPLPPLQTGAPANRGGTGNRLRTWVIVAVAALAVVGAAAGAFAAFGSGRAAPPTAGAVAAGNVTRQKSPVAAGHSVSPAPSRSTVKAASRSGESPKASASSASAPVAPAVTTVSSAPSAPATSAAPVPATSAAPAPATSAAPAPAVTVTVSVGPCGAFPSTGASIWRCNGTAWLAISCTVAESNGTSGPYNVWQASNKCGDRVWLHQDAYPADQKSGWAYCISPGATVKSVPAQYMHPLNIQVSGNSAACLFGEIIPSARERQYGRRRPAGSVHPVSQARRGSRPRLDSYLPGQGQRGG